MGHQAINRLLLVLCAALATRTDAAVAQRRCKQTSSPDSAAVDAIFLAQLDSTESYRQMISIDGGSATWPMVRFHLRPLLGWKLDPRTYPYAWYPDTLGHFLISVTPQQDPGVPATAWVLVYMKLAYLQVKEPGDSVARPLRDRGILQLVDCGLRLVVDTSSVRRLYGSPHWRKQRRS